jgi:hypothetical protein
MFYPFSQDPSIELVGVEAAGDGLCTARHSATLSRGSVGALHGVRIYVLEDQHGRISEGPLNLCWSRLPRRGSRTGGLKGEQSRKLRVGH